MKKFYLLLFWAFFPLLANASVEIDGIYYDLNPSNSGNRAIVTTLGDVTGYTGDIVIPSTVTYGNVTYNVTSIGEAFMYCSNLTSIKLPNSVTSIGNFAFYGCCSLKFISISNMVTSIGNSAFNGCSSLTSITIPENLTSIGENAFSGCSGLTSLIIPWHVTSIGNCAFYACSGLESIQVDTNNKKYDSRDDSNAIIEKSSNKLILGCKNTLIPNSVTSIESYAFSYCSSLTSIMIPNSVTSIGDHAFWGCKSLTTIEIPNSVTSIESFSFSNCSGLTSITIPNSVTSIGESAFSACSGLTSIRIPNSVTSIESCTFYNCNSLITVTIPNSVTSIGNFAFNGCSSLTSITIPENLTSIGENAFSGCSGLTSLIIPWHVTSIGNCAFSACSGLESIQVETGNSKFDSRWNCNAIIETSTNKLIFGCKNTIIHMTVNSIDSYAFYGCGGLTSIVIPNSIKSIPNNVFSGCSGLTSIAISESVTSIGKDAFSGCTSLRDFYSFAEDVPSTSAFPSSIIYRATLHVLSGRADAYKASYTWKEFGTIKDDIDKVNYSSDGNYYQVNKSDKTAKVIPSPQKYTGEVIIPSKVTLEDISYSVTSIGQEAFAGCRGMISVSLPNSITSIDRWAFGACSDLKNVYCHSEVVPTTHAEAFLDTDIENAVTLYVPVGSVDAYNTMTPWNLFKEITTGAPTAILGLIYSGEAQNLIIEGTSLYGTMLYSLDGKIFSTDIPQGTHAKEYIVYYKVQGNNSESDVESFAVTIAAKTVDNPVITLSETTYIYDGTAKEPTVTIKDGSTIIPNSEYFVSYSNNTNGGTATVTITDKEGGDYIVNGSATFSINADPVKMEIDGIYYFINVENKTATVIAKPDYSQKYSGIIIIPETLYIPLYPNICVTSIGDGAFWSCSGLTSITLPSGLTSIGGEAFSYCSGLTSISIPNSVLSIGNEAFSHCSGLTSLTIPNSVTYVGNEALSYCTNLISLTIPNNVTSIGDKAFYGCTSLTDVSIGSGVSSIGDYVFGNCTSLTDVSIGNGVTSIGDYAFSFCINLTSITIPNSVTSIGIGAFLNCSGLTSITIPNSVTSIGNEALSYCTNLISLTIPNNVTSIGDKAFYGCTSLTDVSIGSGVSSIGDYVFGNCTSLTDVSIGNGVTSIGDYAFSLCINLTSITIPNNVSSIGYMAFNDCEGLTAVTISSSLTSIGKAAFYYCLGLKDVYCYSMDVPITDLDAFSSANIGNATLHVPAGSIHVYNTTAPWSRFNKIVGDVNLEITEITNLFSGTDMWAGYVADEDQSLTTGLTAYTITAVDNTTVTATSLDYIPKDIPVLLKRSDTSINSFILSPGTGTAPTTNLLEVYATDKTVSNREGYVLYKDEFVLVNAGTLPAGRIFLPLNGGNAAATRGIVIEGEGTTGIRNLVSDSEASHGEWYDLQGRKLDGKPIRKGVYILNGHKVVVK